MKKLLSFLLFLALVLPLAACSGETTSSPETDSAEPSVSSFESSSADTSEATAEPEESSGASDTTEAEGGGTLVAYFSWSGNTEQMANMIQQETGGDLFEIAPATPYTDDYDTLLDVARQEQAEDARPALASQVENWDSYDVVFVGYPDWWSDAPMLIYSFLEAYSWEGKALVPFCTSGGSGFGRSLDKLADSAPSATILEGLHVSGNRVGSAGEDVAAWIDGLNLT
ncbi:MAG: flavodoxin [Clostridiales bacterium]|nr:flavodoxin [Clostridiales bacterium]